MAYITYEEAAALTLEERITLARKAEPSMGEHILVVEDLNMIEWTGQVDEGGWEVYDLSAEIKTWCDDNFPEKWRLISVLYAQGRSIGSDYFLHIVEFDELNDAVHFRLRWM